MKRKLSSKWGLLYCVASALLILQACEKEQIAVQEPEAVMNTKGIASAQVSNVPAPCIQRCLVAGKNTNVGSIDVAVNGTGDLLVTYNITKPNIYLLETHTDIFRNVEQFKQDKKMSNGGATPGKFAYKMSWSSKDKATSYTVVIPKAYVDKHSVNGCVMIATHAALSNGETAWGGICTDTPKGTSLENARQFPGGNWSVYFDFCMNECQGKDFTYAFEDLRNDYNDADYNDLVIQADAFRKSNEMRIKFFVTARGASFDHQFKIKIPKLGITSIEGANGEPAPTFTSSGADYIITVINSTKEALPTNTELSQTNTFMDRACAPYGEREIVLKVNSSFVYNTARPYDPFITVFPSGKVGEGESYDLSIFELTGKDTWVSPNGAIYPNGIIIPQDWSWPVEQQHITGPYPSFPKPNWAANIANPSLLYDKNKCK